MTRGTGQVGGAARWSRAGLCAVVLLWGGLACAGPALPNIVFFLVDDLGWRDTGCYGSAFYETPAIDRLAEEGVRFTRAYAAHPRCVPSRHAIYTGQFPARAGVPGRSYNLEPEAVTFAEVLRERGYATFFAGKWHLSKSEAQEPQHQGFDVNIAGGAAGAPPSYFYPYNETRTAGHRTAAGLRGLEDGQPGEYLTDRLTEETVRFLRDHRRDHPGRPFLAVLSHYAVHTPFEAKPDLVEQYRQKIERTPPAGPAFADRDGTTKLHQDNPVYAAMVHSMDESLGRVLEVLDELDIAADTAVVFTSDHGGLSNRGRTNRRPLATSNLPLRAGKGHLYEGGLRVPLIVRWPGRIPAGRVSGAVVNGTDHFATLLELAGAPPPAGLDGASYLPACTGDPGPRGLPLFWHSPKGRPDATGDTNSSALLEGNLKLIEFYDEDRVELYDLAADPGENASLHVARPGVAAAMRDRLRAWRLDIDAFRDAPAP